MLLQSLFIAILRAARKFEDRAASLLYPAVRCSRYGRVTGGGISWLLQKLEPGGWRLSP